MVQPLLSVTVPSVLRKIGLNILREFLWEFKHSVGSQYSGYLQVYNRIDLAMEHTFPLLWFLYFSFTACVPFLLLNFFSFSNGVFFFLSKNVHFISKNVISCLLLKNVSPSKRVACFILNNLHFPMVQGIAFYALHKSKVLIIPCKADDFCLFIALPDDI